MSGVEDLLAEVMAIVGELFADPLSAAADVIAQLAADVGAAWAGANDPDTAAVLRLLGQAGHDVADCVAAANQAAHQLSDYAATL